MLSALLTQLDGILHDKYTFSETRNQEILAFFNRYSSGEWIYPGVIKRHLSMPIDTVYKLLSELEVRGAVESWYEYCCGHCQRVLGTVQVFNQLPEYFDCEVCGAHMNTMDNTIKIYKVC
jgi:hypothetical protein